MSEIFISYSRKDKHWVEILATALEAEGYSVWWDTEILPGQDFETVIKEILDTTKCVITIWSQESIKSHWVKAESAKGLDKDIFIPVLYQNVSIPMPFDRIQTADLQSWKGDTTDSRYQKLLKAISFYSSMPANQSTLTKQKSEQKPKIALPWLLATMVIIITLIIVYNKFQHVEYEPQEEIKTLSIQKKTKPENVVKQDKSALQIKKHQSDKNKYVKNYSLLNATDKVDYKDNGDGTISDNVNNIMWKKCSEGQEKNNCDGNASKVKWDDAIELYKKETFAGYNDWRLPTINELRTLVYCSNGTPQKEAWRFHCNLIERVNTDGKVNSSKFENENKKYQNPTINLELFPNTAKSSFIWSSTSSSGNNSRAWHIGLMGGYHGNADKSNFEHIRLVRTIDGNKLYK